MSTEIASVSSSSFEILNPESDIREAMIANLADEGGSVDINTLPKVSMPTGGGKNWSWTDSNGTDQSSPVIEGLMVFKASRGVLWPSEEPTSLPPVLITNDLKTAYRVSDEIGDLDSALLEKARVGDRTYDWQRLHYNSYGTASNGRSKRCKESRILGILQAGEAWPVMVQIGTGSLRTVVPWLQLLKLPYHRCIVRLGLDKTKNNDGQAYAVVVPETIGSVSKEEGQFILDTYTNPLKAAFDAQLPSGD